MRTPGLWLLFVLSMWSLSAAADVGVGKSEPQIPATYTTQHLKLPHCHHQDSVSLASLNDIKKFSAEHFSFAELQHKIKTFSQGGHSDISVAPEYSILREVSQSEPEYWLAAEFNPPDPAIKSLTDLCFPNNDTPWYLTLTQRTRVKLSAWKDSNTLYRSKLIYYI